MSNFAPFACPAKALASKIALFAVVSSSIFTKIVTVPPAPAAFTAVSLIVLVANDITNSP